MPFRLIPADDAFLALFNDSAANVADCARRLRDLLGPLARRPVAPSNLGTRHGP